MIMILAIPALPRHTLALQMLATDGNSIGKPEEAIHLDWL